MTGLVDVEVRRRIAEEFGTTFFVEAAAGTGKTTALVNRIVALIRAGVATLDRIVAVTFTEKAAGETKLHLRSEIEATRAMADPEQRARLDRALQELELARIGTIHAFCGDLLREHPVEACIDPLFEVAADDESQALLDEAFDGWFETILADPPEGIRRLLRRRSQNIAPRALRGLDLSDTLGGRRRSDYEFAGPGRPGLNTTTWAGHGEHRLRYFSSTPAHVMLPR